MPWVDAERKAGSGKEEYLFQSSLCQCNLREREVESKGKLRQARWGWRRCDRLPVQSMQQRERSRWGIEGRQLGRSRAQHMTQGRCSGTGDGLIRQNTQSERQNGWGTM